jgi:hypothetical protein
MKLRLKNPEQLIDMLKSHEKNRSTMVYYLLLQKSQKGMLTVEEKQIIDQELMRRKEAMQSTLDFLAKQQKLKNPMAPPSHSEENSAQTQVQGMRIYKVGQGEDAKMKRPRKIIVSSKQQADHGLQLPLGMASGPQTDRMPEVNKPPVSPARKTVIKKLSKILEQPSAITKTNPGTRRPSRGKIDDLLGGSTEDDGQTGQFKT